MNKKTHILLFTVILLFTLDYSRVYLKFSKERKIINERINGTNYIMFLKGFVLDKNLPRDLTYKSIIEVDKRHITNLDEYNRYVKQLLGDNFKYFPLYNRKNKIEGYMLLIPGIDGKINNNFKNKNYVEEIERFKLYSHYYDFSYYNYYFGKKDALVSMASPYYPDSYFIKTIHVIEDLK